jgi:hypothetical protein
MLPGVLTLRGSSNTRPRAQLTENSFSCMEEMGNAKSLYIIL